MSAAGQLVLAHLLVVSVGSLVPWRSARVRDPPTRVAVLGGGFAGLTAARTLAATPGLEVLLVDQREYFEYTPGILRAWVDTRAHARLVNPIRRLLRGPRASFQRVPPGYVATLEYRSESANGEAVERPSSLRERPPSKNGGKAGRESEVTGEAPREASGAPSPELPSALCLRVGRGEEHPTVSYECEYAILATGGELAPVSDDRRTADGSIRSRRRRLEAQVQSVLGNASTALVVGGGLTGVELAAELAERLGGSNAVTLAVGPTRPVRGKFPGDPGSGLLPGFADTCRATGRGGAGRYCRKWLDKHGVRLLERWAVPPLVPGESWRDGGGGEIPTADAWEEAGPAADICVDAVFDCRGLRPNTRTALSLREAATARATERGLPAACVAPSGWLYVDDHFRLAAPPVGAAEGAGVTAGGAEGETAVPPVAIFGGRVYCVGDLAEKDKFERTAANAHAEGEYAALDIVRAVRGKGSLPPYVSPPRLCAISLGRYDGVVVLGVMVALRGDLSPPP